MRIFLPLPTFAIFETAKLLIGYSNMIRARVYLEGKILLNLTVDGTTVFSVNEDQPGDFSKIRIVDTSWKSTSSNVHEISAKVGCVRQIPVCYIKETFSVTVAAIFGTPLFLADDVYLVMMPVERGSPLMKLQELHYKTLQKLCRAGPSPPFDQLCVTRKEWAESYASGVECRAAMISNVTRYHLLRASRKPLKEPNEHVSFVVYAEGCEAIFVESPITSQCDVNSDQIVEVRFEDSHAVSGRLRRRSRGFRVSIRCTGDCCANGSVHRTVIESPDFFTPYPLTPRGSILFFHTDDARYYPRLGPLSGEHATVPSGSYTLEVVCMPKRNAIVMPLALFAAGGGPTYISPGDVVPPTVRLYDKRSLREGLREMGYAAYSYFSPPKQRGQSWKVKLVFRYLKMDTTDPAAFCIEDAAKYRIGEILIEVRDSDIGERIPLSSSSFLKILPADPSNAIESLRFEPFSRLQGISQATGFDRCGAGHIAGKGVVLGHAELVAKVKDCANTPSPRRSLTQGVVGLDEDTQYLARLCAMGRDELQATCERPSEADMRALSRDEWGDCWKFGPGSRSSMLINAAAAMKTGSGPLANHPYLPYISGVSRESSEVFSCLQRLSLMGKSDVAEIQTNCRQGGTYLPFTAALAMSPDEWKQCFRSGDGCDEAMLAEIRASLDQRNFRCIRIVDRKVAGFLDSSAFIEKWEVPRMVR